MRRKKEDSEFEFDLSGEKQYAAGEKKYSAREIVMYVVILAALVAALIVLGILIWRVSRDLFQTDEKETVEVVQGLEEEGSGTEPDADEGLEEETSGESGQESEAADGAEAEASGAGTSEGDAGTKSGQENVTAGSADTGSEASVSASEDSQSTGSAQTDSGTAAEAQDTNTSTASMTFTEVSETVMAKSATNLRSEPSTESADTVVLVLESGIEVARTGINADTGWSRLSYDGQVLYAVSSLLTTDLSGQTTGEVAADPDRVTTQDGRVIIFLSCDDTVTPKMSVNLRTEPSTSQGDATVYYELQYGETVRRTGYDQDAGWSRVEYNGQTLYAVTSYLYIVE